MNAEKLNAVEHDKADCRDLQTGNGFCRIVDQKGEWRAAVQKKHLCQMTLNVAAYPAEQSFSF